MSLGLRRQHGSQLRLLDHLDPVWLRPGRLARARVVEVDLRAENSASRQGSAGAAGGSAPAPPALRTATKSTGCVAVPAHVCQQQMPLACLPWQSPYLAIRGLVFYPDLFSWGHRWRARGSDGWHSWREHHTRRWWHATHGRRHKWWSLKAYNNNSEDNGGAQLPSLAYQQSTATATLTLPGLRAALAIS